MEAHSVATYVLPQVRVFQELPIIPAAAANPLRAHISGGHAALIRYAEDDERNNGALGVYDRLADTDYTLPHRPAGGKVDGSYLKLWIKNALLKYFEDTISSGSVITKVSGYNNRVASATISFIDNPDDPTTYPKSASLKDRGAAVGDVVKVRGINSDDEPVTLWTTIKAFHGEQQPGDIAALESDDNNATSQSASASITQTGGAVNCVTTSATAASYDGRVSGFLSETYDILVTEGSVNSDYTVARLRVISGSGLDDADNVAPSAAGLATAIGARGLEVIFNEADTAACSASAASDSVSPDDLIAGQRWQVTVHGVFAAPTATSDGDYDGTKATTYILTVTRGGLFSDDTPPQIKVTTTTGVDTSGPTSITVSGNDYAVGQHGVTVSFTGTGLCKGDRYYITVTSPYQTEQRIIELAHNLDTDIAGGSQVDLTLFIKKGLLEVPQNREDSAPDVNWEHSETQFTVKAGITAEDPTWTDDGTMVPLDVWSESSKSYGLLFLETRYWLQDLCGEVNGISDVGDINDLISGALHPDNPLKWGVFKALENSNGTEVRFTSVCDPDDDASWADVLELLLGNDTIYGLVPLTRRRSVLDLYAAHVDAQSSPEENLWRVMWLNLPGLPVVPLVSDGSNVDGHATATTSDGEVALAVIEDDPGTAGSQYTILRCTTANADFITNGVRAGDIVRATYTDDGFGNASYSEYIVDDVSAEDELRLVSGPDAPISVAAKFEVWRNLSATEESAAIARLAGSWGNRRVRATWPDTIEAGGTVMEGYFLNCSLAGLVSGVLPHQGLTRLEIVGYDAVPRTTEKFGRAQLNAMAVSGVWIVTQDTNTGQVFTRHALTTSSYDNINEREEMITRNTDSISFRFADYFKPFIGVTNVTPTVQAMLEAEFDRLVILLKNEAITSHLGPQLISAVLVGGVRSDPVFRDRYIMDVSARLPYATNNIDIHIALV